MHILFVHQNFPAQFGHIAARLAQAGHRCTFISRTPPGNAAGVEKIQYHLMGGATEQTHFCSRTFENAIWHCEAVYDALKDRTDIHPDLIVGHSGFGSTLFLRELYPRVPLVNLFEFYYRMHEPDSDMDFRADLGWPLPPIKYMRARARNAMMLLDLQNCQVGYVPTQFQRSRFPAEYQYKLRTIFDGVDRQVYHGHNEALRPPPGSRSPRKIGDVEIGPDKKILSYVSRGFESMRGFDIFMRAAKIVAAKDPDVEIIVVGSDRISYGGDAEHLAPHKTFRDWVLAQDQYDFSRIHLVGLLPPLDLANLLAMTDLHIYLTAPFVLSWSMMDAMSCGAVVLGSDTTPVREMIRDGENGLLADFFSPEGIADKALKVLADPAAYRPLGRAAEQMIAEKYSLDVVLPQMTKLYEEAASMMPKTEAVAPAIQLPPPPPEEVLMASRSRIRSPFRG